MRPAPSPALEQGRLRNGHWRSDPGDLHGAFQIVGPHGRDLMIVSSGTGDGAEGWEHVSVSTTGRTPNWTEMCFIKSLFWNDDECVVQYHPPASSYVNHHPYCLHMWKPLRAALPLPPMWMVGPKG